MKKINRLFWLPVGFVAGLLELANDRARDMQNKRRFPSAIIDKGSSFTEDVTLGTKTRICEKCTINMSHIGSFSYINNNSIVQYANIGNYCSIASDVKIGLGTHPMHLFSTAPLFYRKQNPHNLQIIKDTLEFKENSHTTIENDVWIGANVIVMDGVKIGNGAVIAAGAVVTKDVPSYAVVAGVPAKLIKYRFEESIREELNNLKWWSKQPEEVFAMKDTIIRILEA